jgi:dinuclear metal center YbgI/SA1388 family protein
MQGKWTEQTCPGLYFGRCDSLSPDRLPVHAAQLSDYCDVLLDVERFRDHCPNGLQVEGGRRVELLVSGVTASQALIEAALDAGAEALLVHHGLFWNGSSPCIRGITGRRVAALVRADVSLLAYHLPLDAHPELGNNARLAAVLGWQEPLPAEPSSGLLWHGLLPRTLSLEGLAAQVQRTLGRAPLTIAGGSHPVQRLAWCSGAGQGAIGQAAALGVDAYLSGEISEPTVHQARELGIHYLAAGHHATERYGVQALGAHLAARFGLRHLHIEIDNPA